MKLHSPTFGQEEIDAAVHVMQSTQVTQGERVALFEQMFRPGSVACNSGSSANLLAVSALVATGKLKRGDRVIVPALCWSTTVWPLVQNGLEPVIVDIDPDTLNIDPERAEVAVGISEPRAIMPVHVYGNPCDMVKIKNLCERHGLWLIEDCCESMGAELDDGSPIGSTADVATFSTYFSHHITTFEGGFAHTDNPVLRDMMRIQRSHGWLRDVENPGRYETGDVADPRFTFVEAGYNLRMTEVQAAVGLVQLQKLKDIVDARRCVWSALAEALLPYPWLRLQDISMGSSCFGFTMVATEDSDYDVSVLRQHLEDNGIEARPIICGNIVRQPGLMKYRHRVVGELTHANEVMDQGISIGCHQNITTDDAKYVGEVIGTIEPAARDYA